MKTAHHILLLRHGLTDANARGVIQGHQPTPLNSLGFQQAQCLARRLAQRRPPLELLVSSDLLRAAQTAKIVGEACRLPVRYDMAWRERYFGEWEGTTAAQREIWKAASGDVHPPGAESADAFASRIHHALTALPSRHPDFTLIGVVTHGGPCRTVLKMLADGRLPLAEGQSPPELVMIANCSIMHLIHEDGRWRLVGLNDVEHLAEPGITLKDAG